MKKQLLFITAVLSLVFCFSCKKENTTNTPGNPAANNVKVKTQTGNWGTTTYTYDGNGRVTLEQNSSGSKVTYDYQNGMVIKKQYNTGGVNDFTAQFEVGANGLIIKETHPNSPTYVSISVYNNDQEIVKRTITQNGVTDAFDYFYSNGNCDSVRNSSNGNWNSTEVYTYFTDKLNSLDNNAYGLPYFGKGNKNLVKTEQWFYSGGQSTSLYNYSYEWDGNGMVSKETVTWNANINISYFTYF